MIPPSVQEPPDWPLPDPVKDSGWYAEIWLKYPLVPDLQPTHFGHILRARSKFRVIMNQYCNAAFSSNGTVSLDEARRLHEQLKSWYSDLSLRRLHSLIIFNCSKCIRPLPTKFQNE
ncbi:uncharacterized protein BDZ83DRAFT_635346 [Colletotrichum acutatum]|uniref:Uncharacterized protein n=1 Tax=Glomerella acutata TaxID=27357 RepID=A0AAD8XAT1_GLOAC|nr:uncharacterized protein BDZ83DRAFT_635346 [Colletotrichum acutatum]KAK1716018.1 hypothetical protein BDZ83DRAFT_635346 [Colletotrichum acutatum]